MNLLIIEDDRLFRDNLKSDLETLNYNIITHATITDQMYKDLINIDVVLLDINLPGQKGFDYIEDIRARGPKVIMLTSEESPELEHLCLINGAVDYIVKPYYLATLDFKIKRLMENATIITVGNNSLNMLTMELNGRIKLTKKEFKVLAHLMQCSSTIVSKEDILELLWESSIFVELGSLNVLMSRLRTKIKSEDLEIKTVSGKGYIIEKN